MTRDDIKNLMQQACDPDKKPAWHNGFWTITQLELERFADLVLRAERQACAQVCDELANGIDSACWEGAETAADAIRAREKA
jgi:hypothetical protein